MVPLSFFFVQTWSIQDFSSWQTILTDKSYFLDLCWWVHKTNLLYKTTLIAHFVLLFGQHVALFESRHKHEYLPKWHHKILHRTWAPKNQSYKPMQFLGFQFVNMTLSSYTLRWTLKPSLFVLVFYHHSLECHKYIRITLFWVKLKFQSDQHVCAVMS